MHQDNTRLFCSACGAAHTRHKGQGLILNDLIVMHTVQPTALSLYLHWITFSSEDACKSGHFFSSYTFLYDGRLLPEAYYNNLKVFQTFYIFFFITDYVQASVKWMSTAFKKRKSINRLCQGFKTVVNKEVAK